MSQATETVLVIRKDHPDGKVLINKADMIASDIEYSSESSQEIKSTAKSRLTGSQSQGKP